MSKKSKILIIVGVVLIFSSFLLMIFSHITAKNAKLESEKIVSQLEVILSERSEGVAENYLSLEMPVLEVENQDVVGIVEIPNYKIKLPVFNEWDSNMSSYSVRRITGSVYDNSLVIGGSDKQFECVSEIQIGEEINLVDMTGAEFSYEISEIFRSKQEKFESLLTHNDDFMILVQEQNTMEYIVICCKLK